MASTKKKNPLLAMSAGCIAGGIEATAVWPMEYIKVGGSVPVCSTVFQVRRTSTKCRTSSVEIESIIPSTL